MPACDSTAPARECADRQTCVNSCGTGPCSRCCRVCKRLAGSGSVPCPACLDIPAGADEIFLPVPSAPVPVSQNFVLIGGLWTCCGCGAQLTATENGITMTHSGICTEISPRQSHDIARQLHAAGPRQVPGRPGTARRQPGPDRVRPAPPRRLYWHRARLGRQQQPGMPGLRPAPRRALGQHPRHRTVASASDQPRQLT